MSSKTCHLWAPNVQVTHPKPPFPIVSLAEIIQIPALKLNHEWAPHIFHRCVQTIHARMPCAPAARTHAYMYIYIYNYVYIYICIQLYNIIHMHVRFPSETTIPCWDSKASIWTISHLQNMKAHLDHQSFLRWNKPNLFKPTTHSYYWFIVYILCLYHSHFMVEPCWTHVSLRLKLAAIPAADPWRSTVPPDW